MPELGRHHRRADRTERRAHGTPVRCARRYGFGLPAMPLVQIDEGRDRQLRAPAVDGEGLVVDLGFHRVVNSVHEERLDRGDGHTRDKRQEAVDHCP